jgi:hypothetical protein
MDCVAWAVQVASLLALGTAVPQLVNRSSRLRGTAERQRARVRAVSAHPASMAAAKLILAVAFPTAVVCAALAESSAQFRLTHNVARQMESVRKGFTPQRRAG